MTNLTPNSAGAALSAPSATRALPRGTPDGATHSRPAAVPRMDTEKRAGVAGEARDYCQTTPGLRPRHFLAAWEAFANAAIGLLISWAATWLLLGYSPAASVGVSLLFFGLSFARSYVLRRVFARMA